MRAYAFITDIHGNQTALDAVLEDISKMQSSCDFEQTQIVCLGDSFDGGPDPSAVFETLQRLSCPHLRGNHEDYLLQCLRSPNDEKFQRPLWKFIPWTMNQLGSHISNLETQLTAHWSAYRDPLYAVHASLQTNQRVPDFFIAQSRLSARFVESFSEAMVQEKKIYFNGHSHYLGRHGQSQTDSVWFNCGSVGYPFVEKSEAHGAEPLATWVWTVVDDTQKLVSITNRRVPYSSDFLLKRYVDSGALEQCAPFSFAILAQSLFNEDFVYPFFQRFKKTQMTPREMAKNLVVELEKQDVFERINRLLRKARLKEVIISHVDDFF